MCNCQEMSDAEGQAFESEFDLVKRQREELDAHIARVSQVNRAKLAGFDLLVEKLHGAYFHREFGGVVDLLIAARKLQRGEL